MADAAAEYRKIESEMLASRLLPTHTDADEDRFLDILESCWWKMTIAEREAENARVVQEVKQG